MAGARARKIDLSQWAQAEAGAAQHIADAGRAKGAGWQGLLGNIGAGVQQFGQNRREASVRAEAKAERSAERSEDRADRQGDRDWKRQMEVARLSGRIPDDLIRGTPPGGLRGKAPT